MKWNFLLIAVLLVPLVGETVEGVRLVCDEPVYDFGQVDQSAVVTHVFTIRNEGDLSFLLKYVRTSCGCTKGKMNKRVIGPGETAELTAVFAAARRKGVQKKRLALVPIDPAHPPLVFYLKGSVQPAAGSQ